MSVAMTQTGYLPDVTSFAACFIGARHRRGCRETG